MEGPVVSIRSPGSMPPQGTSRSQPHVVRAMRAGPGSLRRWATLLALVLAAAILFARGAPVHVAGGPQIAGFEAVDAILVAPERCTRGPCTRSDADGDGPVVGLPPSGAAPLPRPVEAHRATRMGLGTPAPRFRLREARGPPRPVG